MSIFASFFYLIIILTSFFFFNVAIFAFNLYDTDQDGVLTDTEAKVMFHDLYWHNKIALEDKLSITYEFFAVLNIFASFF